MCLTTYNWTLVAACFTFVAGYYEKRGELDKAADTWAKGDQHIKAVQLYLKVINLALRDLCAADLIYFDMVELGDAMVLTLDPDIVCGSRGLCPLVSREEYGSVCRPVNKLGQPMHLFTCLTALNTRLFGYQ